MKSLVSMSPKAATSLRLIASQMAFSRSVMTASEVAVVGGGGGATGAFALALRLAGPSAGCAQPHRGATSAASKSNRFMGQTPFGFSRARCFYVKPAAKSRKKVWGLETRVWSQKKNMFFDSRLSTPDPRLKSCERLYYRQNCDARSRGLTAR